MIRIHCISGLGADHRVFTRLDIPGAQLIPVPWVAFDKHDDLPCYAQKLSAVISEERPVILGLSFGGMLAAEIARMREVQQVFLLSSAKNAAELPPISGFIRFLAENRLVPVGMARMAGRLLYERFGAATDDEKALLMDILKNTDPAFARWAMKAIVEWRTQAQVGNLVHIHGTADKIIPPDLIKPTHWVEGGTHLMIYQRAAEISALMAQHLV